MEEDDTEENPRSLNDNRQLLCRCCPVNSTVHRIGLIYSAMAAIFFGISEFLIALCGQKYDPLQIIFEIYSTAAFCAAISMTFLCVPIKLFSGERLYVFLHALAMDVSEISGVYSLTLIAPSLAVVIIDMNPIFATLLAFIFLCESVDLYDGISILITCIGAVAVSVPTILLASSASLKSVVLGVSSAFVSSIAIAMYSCFNRNIERTHPSVITVVAFVSLSFVEGVICFATGRFRVDHDARYLMIIIGSGVLISLGHILLARSLQLTVASYVNTANSIDTPTVMILQTIFLNVHLTVFPILGSFTVIIGVTLLGLKECIWTKLRGLFHQSHSTRPLRSDETKLQPSKTTNNKNERFTETVRETTIISRTNSKRRDWLQTRRFTVRGVEMPRNTINFH